MPGTVDIAFRPQIIGAQLGQIVEIHALGILGTTEITQHLGVMAEQFDGMLAVGKRGLVVLTVAVDRVVDEVEDRQLALEHKVDVLRDAQHSADRQRPLEVIAVAVVEGGRFLLGHLAEAVLGAVAEQVLLVIGASRARGGVAASASSRTLSTWA